MIDGDRYGDLAARSALCGKQVKLTNTKNGKVFVYLVEPSLTSRFVSERYCDHR
jgi:hypothetical protein